MEEKDATWGKVICNLHSNDGDLFSVVGPRINKGVWLNIVSVGVAINTIGILSVILSYEQFKEDVIRYLERCMA